MKELFVCGIETETDDGCYDVIDNRTLLIEAESDEDAIRLYRQTYASLYGDGNKFELWEIVVSKTFDSDKFTELAWHFSVTEYCKLKLFAHKLDIVKGE